MLHNTSMHAVSQHTPYRFLFLCRYLFGRMRMCWLLCVCMYVCSRNDFVALHHIFFFSCPNVTTATVHGVCDFCATLLFTVRSFVRCVLNIGAARSLLQLYILCVFFTFCAPALYVNLVCIYPQFVLSSCYCTECVSDTVNYYKETERTSHFVCVLSPKERLIYFFILKTKSIICFYVVFFSFLVISSFISVLVLFSFDSFCVLALEFWFCHSEGRKREKNWFFVKHFHNPNSRTVLICLSFGLYYRCGEWCEKTNNNKVTTYTHTHTLVHIHTSFFESFVLKTKKKVQKKVNKKLSVTSKVEKKNSTTTTQRKRKRAWVGYAIKERIIV